MSNNSISTESKSEEKKNNVLKIIDTLYLDTKNKNEAQTTRTFLSCKIIFNYKF
jgi:hypothetical protein